MSVARAMSGAVVVAALAEVMELAAAVSAMGVEVAKAALAMGLERAVVLLEVKPGSRAAGWLAVDMEMVLVVGPADLAAGRVNRAMAAPVEMAMEPQASIRAAAERMVTAALVDRASM